MSKMWKAVAGYEGLYSVSDQGDVRSVRNGKLMTPVVITDGYHGLKLYKAGDAKAVRVHAIVCEAFHGPRPSEKHQVAHQDGCRTNNSAQKRLHGTHQSGAKHPRARLTEDDVSAIRASTARRKEIAIQFGVSQWTVKEIRMRKRWREACQPGPSGCAQGGPA